VEASFVWTSAGRVGAAKIGTANLPASPNLEVFQKFSAATEKFEKKAVIPWNDGIFSLREIGWISSRRSSLK
jgi:hypothetical protein